MKKLVAYFSASGVTAGQARRLAAVAQADLHEIAPQAPYSAADLNWRDPDSRCCRENADPAARPALAEPATDLSGYDVIYLGFPIWWGEAPRIINSFLEANDCSGKPIAVFATSGGSGVSGALQALKEAYPQYRFVSGTLLNGPVTKDIL